ncbi:MAG: hypothetical protein M1357_00935 [Candidatus Marsarchaeota archaeon]|nr:hypothetical protein [Candidatus Marsarchaeota archaeon]
MGRKLELSDELASRIDQAAKRIESALGKKPSDEEVLAALLEVYFRNEAADDAKTDMFIQLWDKVSALEKRVGRIEDAATRSMQSFKTVNTPQPTSKTSEGGVGASTPQSPTPVTPSKAAAPHDSDKKREPGVQSVKPSATASPASAASASPGPVAGSAVTPRVVQNRPVSASPPPAIKSDIEQNQDRFMAFMESVVVYPIEKLRKPRAQIDKMVEEGKFEVMTVGGQEVLIHKEILNEFVNKLPIPLNEKDGLSAKELKVLETLRSAGLVVEDKISGKIKEV